jgi:hypothetical protein
MRSRENLGRLGVMVAVSTCIELLFAVAQKLTLAAAVGMPKEKPDMGTMGQFMILASAMDTEWERVEFAVNAQQGEMGEVMR